MGRLTTNKDVSEMNMVELAHNSCYVKDHYARFRNYDLDVDARVLAMKLLMDLDGSDGAFTCNEEFDEWMEERLQDGMDNVEGLIAVFYRNLWAMAELRERLKEYEDIGLLPEQIKEVDRLYAEKCKELAELQKSCFSGLELAQIWAGQEKLKEYRKMEEQGKLLKLPCAVGDMVYTNISIKGWYFREKDRPYNGKVVFIGINGIDNFMNVDFGNGRMLQFKFSDIGKTVFHTKGEAKSTSEKIAETEESV